MFREKNFYQSIAVMTGCIVGVGMMSLPFLLQKSGIYSYFFFLFFLFPAHYILHLIYANIIVVTKNYHRLPGYTEIYLGKRGKSIVFFAKIFGNFGALIAYIITSGIFLNVLLQPIFGGNEMIYGSIILFIEAIIVYYGINLIARAELLITSLLLFVVVMITIKGVPVIDFANYNTLDWKYFLLPYGAIFFAFEGSSALPIVAKLLKKDKKKIRKVIQISMLISFFATTLFVFTVLGVTGSKTTPDALAGLNNVMNGGIMALALVFGIFSMFTSFLAGAESTRETLWWDFKINKTVSWAVAVFIPYGFYLLGVNDLPAVVSFVGSICGGLCGLVLLAIFYKLIKQKMTPIFNIIPGKFILYSFAVLFVMGIVYEILFFIFK